MSNQVSLDWWIVKQLRGMVLTDLREFIPENYFSGEVDKFKLHESIANAAYFSSEMRWGFLAGSLGRKLFFYSTAILTARQTSAAEVLMNLGMLAGAEAAQGSTQQLAMSAAAKGVPDGNASVVAEQLRTQDIPTLSNNIRGALEQYICYLTPFEAKPFLPLLEVAVEREDVQLLPADAVLYFETSSRNLALTSWSSSFTDWRTHSNVI